MGDQIWCEALKTIEIQQVRSTSETGLTHADFGVLTFRAAEYAQIHQGVDLHAGIAGF
jgi:hypothetical protein